MAPSRLRHIYTYIYNCVYFCMYVCVYVWMDGWIYPAFMCCLSNSLLLGEMKRVDDNWKKGTATNSSAVERVGACRHVTPEMSQQRNEDLGLPTTGSAQMIR